MKSFSNDKESVMNIFEQIAERYDEESFLKATGFDGAIIGVDEKSMRLIYSVSKCIAILEETMEHEDAVDFFEINTKGAYMGEKTPIWCEDDFDDFDVMRDDSEAINHAPTDPLTLEDLV